MPLFSRNVQLGPSLKLSSWRKIAIGTWRTAGDPSVYAIFECDAGPALAYIEKVKQQSNTKVTLTHFVGKALAVTLARHSDINCVLRFGKLYPRKNVDIFFQVATDQQGKDLSGVTIRNIDKKTILEIAREMDGSVNLVRQKGDPVFKKTKKLMGLVPGLITSLLLNISGFILYSLNIWSPLLGAPKDAFGGAMITNSGSLGLGLAFAPLVPYSRVPLLIAISNVSDKPVVKNGQIVIAPILQLGVTLDHRLIDGVHGSKMVRTLKTFFEDPEGALVE